jgi:hypothetical protein
VYPPLSVVAVRRRWRFYTTAAGRSQVRDFLTAARLPSDDRDEILAAMKDVQANGLPIARQLRGDLYEVRADGRQATYRSGQHGRSTACVVMTAPEVVMMDRRLRCRTGRSGPLRRYAVCLSLADA